jgi:hypothetical protein
MYAITSSKSFRKLFAAMATLLWLVWTVLPGGAQMGRVPMPTRHDYGANPLARTLPATPEGTTPSGTRSLLNELFQPGTQSTSAESATIDFGSVPYGRVGFYAIKIKSTKDLNVDIKDSNGADPSPQYKYVIEEKCDTSGSDTKPSDRPPSETKASGADETKCATAYQVVVIGFMPADDHSILGATVQITDATAAAQTQANDLAKAKESTGSPQKSSEEKKDPIAQFPMTYTTTGRGSSAACLSAESSFFPLNRDVKKFDTNRSTVINAGDYRENGELTKKAKKDYLKKNGDYPALPPDVPQKAAFQLLKYFGEPLRKLLVNCFYQTNSLFSDFNQFQSIFNSASGSTTLNAQLGSLNFINGWQLNVGTNPQVGARSSSSNGTTSSVSMLRFSPSSDDNPLATTLSNIPTLSAASTAQATQNILNGGTVFGKALYPVFLKGSTYTLSTLSLAINEGIDFQKFNNTSTTSTNPSTHTFVGVETYFQFTSANDTQNSSDPAGSIFFGGRYGYSLMNHSYSVQNGFGGRVNSQIAQVGAGILLKNVVSIAAYRGFGPSQVYIDSTNMAQKAINNFQAWSVAIAYQKSSSSKSQ